MNNENISEELDRLIEKMKELGKQSEQFSKARENLIESIEANKKLSEDYSNVLKKCDEYIDNIISSFDENVFNEVSKHLANSKKIVEDCIEKNKNIAAELENRQEDLKETINTFSFENKKNSIDIVTKVESLFTSLRLVNDNINSNLDSIKQIIIENNKNEMVSFKELNNKLNDVSSKISSNNKFISSLQNQFDSFVKKHNEKVKNDKKSFIIMSILLSTTIVLGILILVFTIVK